MKAHLFFRFLDESYRLEGEQSLRLINCLLVPHMKEEDAKDTVRNYRMQTHDMLETIEEYTDYSAIGDLKDNFNGTE